MIALCALLALALLYSLHRHWRYRQEALRLSDEVAQFLSGGLQQPRFSLRDDAFSPLENSVVELETRLQQAAQLRESLSQRNRQMIADLSHQLKTPLSALRLYCEMDAAPHLAQQLRQIERMERLIAALLRLERLEAGAYAFQFSVTDLRQLVEELLAGFRLQHPAKHFTLTGQASLRCDPAFLAEAISNLLKNACEHTAADGNIHLDILPGDGVVTLILQDEGGGLPEGEIARLFQRFFRSSQAGDKEGTGLGLAIVREIIRRHHGSIRVENAGKGLRFTILLPDLRHKLKES